jgi:glycosyltransferase involved in cell wall biosynthesis
MKTSIIIPAHNEQNVIRKTLKELVSGVISGELSVYVVCNGCTDKTVSIVEEFGNLFKLIETPLASKTNALNIGDAIASGYPRIYQDADVTLNMNGIRELTNCLKGNKFLAASPKMQMVYNGCSWFVRSYYEIWQELPYVKEGMIGTGVYALSEVGRQRFGKFPEIIADDGYIRSLFSNSERTIVDTCFSLVRAPTNMKGLLKIKTRSRLGGYELSKQFPELKENKQKLYRTAIKNMIGKFEIWPKYLIYIYVNFVSRIRANKYARQGLFTGWERDDSSRISVRRGV